MRHVRRMVKEAFGSNLRKRRLNQKLTQESLAFESGLSLRYIQNLESGDRQPTLETIFKLSFALNTSPQALIQPTWKWWVAEARDKYNS